MCSLAVGSVSCSACVSRRCLRCTIWAAALRTASSWRCAAASINSDEDVRVRSDTGWYKRVLRSLNVQVSTGIPYSHTSNPLCERQICVLKENVRIWCKTERTRDWVRLLPVISLMMNSKESSATRPMSYFWGARHGSYMPPIQRTPILLWVNGSKSKKRRWTRPRLCSRE